MMEDFKQFENLGNEVNTALDDAIKFQVKLSSQLDDYLKDLTPEQRKAQMGEIMKAKDLLLSQNKQIKDLRDGLVKGSR